MSDHDLSDAYLRLRALIPGAYDRPPAPTPEQVWATTEAALRRVLQERDLAYQQIVSPELVAALAAARSEERECCARAIEARAYQLRDHGPTSPEGLLTALAGAQVGALLDAASLLRNGGVEAARDPSRREGPRLEEQCERMQEALERIASWSEAYPLDIFPEPDLKLARELLAAGGERLDAVGAHCMRHVIDGVGKIAREAIRDLGDTPAKTGGAP